MTQAQVLMNKEWEALAGLPDTISWSASTIDPNGNLTIAGNTLVSPNVTAVLITHYDADGNKLWQNTYQHNGNARNYATAIAQDASGNVFIAAATAQASILFDYLVMKLDVSGSIVWTQTFNGTAGLYDVPTAICLDNQGNVFVTGLSFGINSQSDYLSIKYDANGNQQWTSRYDYVGLYEAPIGIEAAASGDIVITGASATGDSVKIPHFWASLLLIFPNNSISPSSSEKIIADSINVIHNWVIEAIPNYIGHTDNFKQPINEDFDSGLRR